jgi:uncharacterized DUF497 family protein
MKALRFDWDPDKADLNFTKHGISFEEAMSVFFDDRAVQFYDDEHSEWENRFLMLGLSSRFRILLVCHCIREDDNVIRIISARKATRKETMYYGR